MAPDQARIFGPEAYAAFSALVTERYRSQEGKQQTLINLETLRLQRETTKIEQALAEVTQQNEFDLATVKLTNQHAIATSAGKLAFKNLANQAYGLESDRTLGSTALEIERLKVANSHESNLITLGMRSRILDSLLPTEVVQSIDFGEREGENEDTDENTRGRKVRPRRSYRDYLAWKDTSARYLTLDPLRPGQTAEENVLEEIARSGQSVSDEERRRIIDSGNTSRRYQQANLIATGESLDVETARDLIDVGHAVN